MLILVLNQSWD